jgi:hypothetical protein
MRWLSLALGLLPFSSCLFCSDVYYVSGVTVTFDAPSGWAAGAYRVEAEGRAFAVTLPVADGGTQATAPLDGGVGDFSRLVVDSAGTGLQSLFLDRVTASTVEVSVRLNGAELTRQTLSPVYATTEPDGPGCAVVRSGTARLSL